MPMATDEEFSCTQFTHTYWTIWKFTALRSGPPLYYSLGSAKGWMMGWFRPLDSNSASPYEMNREWFGSSNFKLILSTRKITQTFEEMVFSCEWSNFRQMHIVCQMFTLRFPRFVMGSKITVYLQIDDDWSNYQLAINPSDLFWL